MSISDTLFIATDMNEEESLLLFLNGETKKIDVGTVVVSDKYSFKWAETENYAVEAHIPDVWAITDMVNAFAVEPTVELYITYRDSYIGHGRRDVLAKTANLLNRINSDVILEVVGLFVAVRKDGHTKLSKKEWTDELLKLIEIPYELLDEYITQPVIRVFKEIDPDDKRWCRNTGEKNMCERQLINQPAPKTHGMNSILDVVGELTILSNWQGHDVSCSLNSIYRMGFWQPLNLFNGV